MKFGIYNRATEGNRVPVRGMILLLFLLPLLLLPQDTLIRWEPARRLTYDSLYKVWFTIDAQDSLLHLFADDTIFVYMRSTDYGNTWGPRLSLNAESTDVGRSDVVLQDSIIYLGTNEYPFSIRYWCACFRKSFDRGLTWSSRRIIARTDCGRSMSAYSDTIFIVTCRRISISGIFLYRSFNGGNTWDSLRITDSLTFQQGAPSLLFRRGILHLCFTRAMPGGGGDPIVYYTRSTDLGLTWSPCFWISDRYWPYAPLLRGGPGNFLFVTWRDAKFSPIDKADVFFRRSTDDGLTWNTLQMLTNDHYCHGVGDMVNLQNDIYIGWFFAGPPRPASVFVITSTDLGLTWHPREVVATEDSTRYPSGSNLAAERGKVHSIFDRRIIGSGRGDIFYRRGTRLTAVKDEQFLNSQRNVSFKIYPNPFEKEVMINFMLQKDDDIKLVIYDVSGKEVKRLIEQTDLNEGEHKIWWNGKDQNGILVPSGIYLCQLRSKGVILNRKLILLR